MGQQIVIEIVGDSSKFSSATDQAIGKSTSLTGKLQGIGKGMVIGGGIAAFGLLENAVGTAIGKLDEAHQAFLDDAVSSSKMALALQNNIPNWDGNTAGAEAFATAAEAMGFSDDAARDSLGQLVGITHNLTEAQSLSSLAMDLSRAKGIDLAAATDVVTKAAEGQGRGLKALGIDVTGLKGPTDLLAAAQKNVQGAAESWAQTNTGKLAVSNQKVQEAMEKVGGVIDKVSQVAVPLLADAFTNIVGVLGTVYAAVQEVTTVGSPVNTTTTRTFTLDSSGQIIRMTIPSGTSAGTYQVTWNGHGDALGLWQESADGSLTLANSFTYGTWGNPSTTVAGGFSDLGFRYQYVGAMDVQWDSAFGLGLLYMHARHESPALGRFQQPDPARAEVSSYSYAANSPVTRVDPSGQRSGASWGSISLSGHFGFWYQKDTFAYHYNGFRIWVDWMTCTRHGFGFSVEITWCGAYNNGGSFIDFGSNFTVSALFQGFPMEIDYWMRKQIDGSGNMGPMRYGHD